MSRILGGYLGISCATARTSTKIAKCRIRPGWPESAGSGSGSMSVLWPTNWNCDSPTTKSVTRRQQRCSLRAWGCRRYRATYRWGSWSGRKDDALVGHALGMGREAKLDVDSRVTDETGPGGSQSEYPAFAVREESSKSPSPRHGIIVL